MRSKTVALMLVAVAGVSIAAADTLGDAGPRTDAATSAVQSWPARVRLRRLSSQLNATGTVQYAGRYTVVNHAQGALTWLPAAGQTFKQGQVLYRVAERPVVLLDGSTPAYRSLSEGESGPDVKQLNADLFALGYATRLQLDPSSDYFSAQTAYALEKLQHYLGIAESGSLKLGEAVFLPAPLRITNVLATLGTPAAANPASTPGPRAAQTSGTTRPHAEFIDLTSTPTTPTTPAPTRMPTSRRPPKPERCKPHQHKRHCKPRKPTKRKPAGRQPPKSKGNKPGNPGVSPTPSGKPGAGSLSPNPAKSGRSGKLGASPHKRGKGSASPAPPAQPILQASSTRREIRVELDASHLSTVKVGDEAKITLPDGRSAAGTIARIGTVASSAGGTATIPVYITLKHPQVAGGVDHATVQVQITTATVRHALAVPVTALIALADGGSAVKILTGRHRWQLVPVTVGLLDDADGLVQVTGQRLAAGEQVLVPGTSAT